MARRCGTSYDRALRALRPARRRRDVDTEEHLADLVLAADPEARRPTCAPASLAPLADAAARRPRQKLTETLRAWLLYQGRRDDIAAALFVHPQTVRYRMGQLRELYGDRLDDPATIRDLTLALA